MAFSNAGSCHFLFSATQEEGEELEEGCLRSPAWGKITAMLYQRCFNPLPQCTSPPPLPSYAFPHGLLLFQGGLGSAPLGANPRQLTNKLSERKSIAGCMLQTRSQFPCELKHGSARLWLGRNLSRKSKGQRARGCWTWLRRNTAREIKLRKSKPLAVIC